MRKIFIGLLLAATAASPALAGKGGHGGGHGNPHGGGGKHAGAQPHGGGNPHQGGNPHRGGGNPHAAQARGGKHGGQAIAFARPASHADRGGHGPKAERQRSRPAQVRVVRFDDKQARKQWKREAKVEREVARQWDRRERFRPAERIVRVERYAPPRTIRRAPTQVVRYVERPVVRYVQPRVVRYVEPRPVRYVTRSYAPVYYRQPAWTPTYWGDDYDDYAPVQRYYQTRYYSPTRYYAPASYRYAPTSYWPDSYSPTDPFYQTSDGGLFGGGDGLLGALLPVVLQSVLGGNLGSGLGGLTGYGGLTNLYSPDVLPLQQASYAPYADGYGNSDLASLLLPSLLGNGSLF